VLDVAEAIRAEVDRVSAACRKWTDPDVSKSRGGGKWSQKEILGHLIDSATNNHQRFVRAQFSDPLVFPGYDQVAWVEANAYGSRAWSELVELWAALNRHLAAAVERVPAGKLGTLCAIGEQEPKPLEWWIRDYLRHLRHHIEQIERG
jgi:DinB superfamily